MQSWCWCFSKATAHLLIARAHCQCGSVWLSVSPSSVLSVFHSLLFFFPLSPLRSSRSLSIGGRLFRLSFGRFVFSFICLSVIVSAVWFFRLFLSVLIPSPPPVHLKNDRRVIYPMWTDPTHLSTCRSCLFCLFLLLFIPFVLFVLFVFFLALPTCSSRFSGFGRNQTPSKKGEQTHTFLRPLWLNNRRLIS